MSENETQEQWNERVNKEIVKKFVDKQAKITFLMNKNQHPKQIIHELSAVVRWARQHMYAEEDKRWK